MRILDLFCGAGGAGMGYHRAGFEVVGVDIFPQPRYPFEFHQADALEYLAVNSGAFDVVHASPPCQHYSRLAARWRDRSYPDLVGATRTALQTWGGPYVIENVVRAPLLDPVILCGTMFGLVSEEPPGHLQRHRKFETSFRIAPPGPCQHEGNALGVYGHGASRHRPSSTKGQSVNVGPARVLMGIPWMTSRELAEAIPPAYTEWIGRRLLDMVDR